MAKPLVTDELWEAVEPLLPEEPPKPKGGRPRIDDLRAALTGILFVRKSGIPWGMLPQEEMGCGSHGMPSAGAGSERVARGGRVGAPAPSPTGPPGTGRRA